MECTECNQRSDWIGEDSNWTPVNSVGTGVFRIYECEVCGNRQRIR